MWPDDIVVFINMQIIYFDTNGACVKSGIYIHACIYMPCIYIYMSWYMYTCNGIYIHSIFPYPDV